MKLRLLTVVAAGLAIGAVLLGAQAFAAGPGNYALYVDQKGPRAGTSFTGIVVVVDPVNAKANGYTSYKVSCAAGTVQTNGRRVTLPVVHSTLRVPNDPPIASYVKTCTWKVPKHLAGKELVTAFHEHTATDGKPLGGPT